MISDPSATDPVDTPEPRRIFIREPGWRVGHKIGSEREFCYVMNPGQDFYHRLLDGEIYIYHGDERLCLACAERRGLLAYEPKGLGRTGSAMSGFVIEYDPPSDPDAKGTIELDL